MPAWVNFRFREFWDVPREIVVVHGGRPYLLDCPFDSALDDYADYYDVFELPAVPADAERASKPLRSWAQRHLGRVAVRNVRFDASRRAQVDLSSVPVIPPE